MYRLVINPNQIENCYITLSFEQNHYLRRVLRLKIDAHFIAINGKGDCWLVELQSTGAKIIKTLTNDNELSINLTLITALPKGSGFDDIVRCGTELGVNQFIPVISERSLLIPSANKLKRWRKIAIEATEQSERDIIPHIFEPIPFNEVFSQIKDFNAHSYIAVARKEAPTLWQNMQHKPLSSSQHILIATGPEGGWTESEIKMAVANGFETVSLGKRILRAITAPIMAVSIIVGIYD